MRYGKWCDSTFRQCSDFTVSKAELDERGHCAQNSIGLSSSIQWCAAQSQLLQVQLPEAFGQQTGEQLVRLSKNRIKFDEQYVFIRGQLTVR